MVTSSLGTGGAETHILTLARALCDKGHRVTLVSDGEYRGEHRHISLPLLQKHAAWRTVAALARLFRREGFDVIHAHARYPALLCRLAGASPLVTTAHWVFKTTFPHRTLSVWGEKTLAVSPDVRDYLVKEYGLSKKSITVTVNGIDTARFAPRKRCDGVMRICLCSRLDADRAAAAYALIAAAPRLTAPFPIVVTIVGDGTEYGRLCRLAEAANRRLGEERVRMLGARENVADILAEQDIFVGVSRAALEAMAAGCAVILAGNEGYLSIFSPHRAARAEESNFCCRGAERLSLSVLEEDIQALLALSKEELSEMGKQNRHYVCEHYPAARMAEDAERVYRAVTRRELVLCGYYGLGNVGDELMRRALTERARQEGYRRLFLLSSRHGYPRAVRALRRGADLMLGGGNLLQDGTSFHSLLFYLHAARLCRGERRLVSAGIGPLSARGRSRAAAVLADFAEIECRTEADGQEMITLLRGGGLQGRLSVNSNAVLQLSVGHRAPRDTVLLALRPHTATDTITEYDLQRTLDSLFRSFPHERLILFPMHPDDADFCRAMGKRHGVRVLSGDADDFLRLLSSCALAIGNRLHLGVTALTAGVPSLLIPQDEKITRFMKDARGVAEALRLPSPVAPFYGKPPTVYAAREEILAVSRALRERRIALAADEKKKNGGDRDPR